MQERIAAAARKAGRRSEEITLVGVSKTHPAEAIRAAYEAGLRHFGENRVQEWKGSEVRSATCRQPGTWSGICRATRQRGQRDRFTAWILSMISPWRRDWIVRVMDRVMRESCESCWRYAWRKKKVRAA